MSTGLKKVAGDRLESVLQKWMSDALSPLAKMPEFTGILTAFRNPFLGVIIGTVFTGIIQLSSVESSGKESVMVADMLHVLGDMERISDYSLNLSSTAKKINRGEFMGKAELCTYFEPINKSLSEILKETVNAYETRDITASHMITQKTEALVKQIKKLKKSDLKSLRNGKTSAESSVYISEYLSVCRRITEHSQNKIGRAHV